MMSQGTSGDSMWMDYAKPANDPGLEGYTLAVAKVAHEAYQQIVYQPWVPLAMAESCLTLARRAPDAERLAWAKEIAAKIQDRLPQNQPEVYALEALYLHEQPEVEIRLQAVRIGDLGITALPNEVYGITGLKLKAQSPLEHTFNIELANGAFGYIPPPEQHFLGGYTTWPARTAGLEVEAEPKIVDRLLSLLEQVSGQPRTLREPPADDYVRAVEQSQPAAFWRLDELAGSVARDASGQNRPGRVRTGRGLLPARPQPVRPGIRGTDAQPRRPHRGRADQGRRTRLERRVQRRILVLERLARRRAARLRPFVCRGSGRRRGGGRRPTADCGRGNRRRRLAVRQRFGRGTRRPDAAADAGMAPCRAGPQRPRSRGVPERPSGA